MKDIWYYKIMAHQIINEIVALGVPKKKIYLSMQQRFGWKPEEAHIAKICTIKQMNRIIAYLHKIKKHQQEPFLAEIRAKRQEEGRLKQLANIEKDRARAQEKARIKAERKIDMYLKQGIEPPVRMVLAGKKNVADNLDELQKLAATLNP